MPKEQYEVSLLPSIPSMILNLVRLYVSGYWHVAKEVDGGGTEGMLRNKICKRLLSNRVQ